jgi:hypothetical protein
MAAVVADLVINKPLGLSPPGIEFKRSHLYDINPVGVGAMGIASLLSVAALSACSATDAAALRLVHRAGHAFDRLAADRLVHRRPLLPGAQKPQTRRQRQTHTCCICEREYEARTLAHCPAYQGPICSLCCSLDARCDDLCKPGANLDRAMERPAAPPAAGTGPALPRNRPRPLPAADDRHRAGAGAGCSACSTPRTPGLAR